jgi:hypothetical protein
MENAPYTIAQALEGIENGEFSSLRDAAAKTGFTKSTLNNHQKGMKSRSEVHGYRQKLSPELELNLVEWILAEDRAGLPPTYCRIRAMVASLQDILGDSTGLGANWHRRFVKRHKSIKILKQRVVEADRVNSCNSEAISEFFDRYEGLISKYHILHENTWNMDESGLQSYEAGNENVVGSSQTEGKRAVAKRPARTCWNTALEAISAKGRKIDPLIIYAGKNVYSTYLPRQFDAHENKDWRFTASENGWTSNDIGVYWLKEVFIPQTQPRNRKTWRLLVLDNHGSHCSYRFMRVALENRVILAYLAPHCSHVIQPLDLSVFGPMKTAYRKELGLRTPDSLSKASFIEIYEKIRAKAMSRSNIESGWRRSGIYPLDRQIPLSSPFVKDVSGTSKSAESNGPTSKTIGPVLAELQPFSTKRDLRSELRNVRVENHSLYT